MNTKQARVIAAATITLPEEPEWAPSARECLAAALSGALDAYINLQDYYTFAAVDQGVGKEELRKWVINPLKRAHLLKIRQRQGSRVLAPF